MGDGENVRNYCGFLNYCGQSQTVGYGTLAEREGFEPSVPGKEYARLAIWCLGPLGHLSTMRQTTI